MNDSRERAGVRTDEERLRNSEVRQHFRVGLGDAIRLLSSAEVIQEVACRLLREHLDASRVHCAELEPDGQHVVVPVDHPVAVPNRAGRYSLADFPTVVSALLAGRSFVASDLPAHPEVGAAEKALFAALPAAAIVVVPLVKGSRLAGMLAVHRSGPHVWSTEEIALIEETAERTWVALEKVRAEESLLKVNETLRRSERNLDALIRCSSKVRYFINADWSVLRQLAGGGFIPDTTAADTNWLEAYIPPEDRPAVRAEIERAIRTKSTYDLEHRVNRVDGTVGWALSRAVSLFDAEGNITEWFGAASDVTAKRRAEIALKELNETLEARVATRTAERNRLWSMTNLLVAVAAFDSTIREVNPAWPALLGWSEAELVGRSYAEFVYPDDVERSLAWAAKLAGGEEVVALENRYRCKDGSYRWIAWAITVDDGVFHCIGRDVTDQKQQAAALAAAEEALRQSQKMEAVGQLTGGIAHDFNNLLAGISGSLELLQTRVAQGRIGDLERYLGAAQGAARRAAALTHRLLAFSRRQTLDPKPTDANRLVAGMEELVRRTVGPEVAVEVVAAGGLWTTLVDPNQLENALLNLCINARDAMPGGGRLTVETGNKWLDERSARERDLNPGQYVSLCVSDNGSGVVPEVIARAFDPFFTTKPIGMGTGLGLSMVYGFVRQSGGQVRIYSEPGQGTMVCLYLPRHHGEMGTAEGHGEPAQSPPRAEAGETVLVVDDEPTRAHAGGGGPGRPGLHGHRGGGRAGRAQGAAIERPHRPACDRRGPARHERTATGRCRAERPARPQGAVHHRVCGERGAEPRPSRSRACTC